MLIFVRKSLATRKLILFEVINSPVQFTCLNLYVSELRANLGLCLHVFCVRRPRIEKKKGKEKKKLKRESERERKTEEKGKRIKAQWRVGEKRSAQLFFTRCDGSEFNSNSTSSCPSLLAPSFYLCFSCSPAHCPTTFSHSLYHGLSHSP